VVGEKWPVENEFALFDVRRSNRKVATTALNFLDVDASARAVIEAQDRRIQGV
jgi:hypothetical protein